MTQQTTALSRDGDEGAAPATYRIIERWGDAGAALAVAPWGRRVVLKPLGDDCMLRRQLHPQIRDRLARIRELAMVEMAHLHAVERIDGRPCMVWQFIEGRDLDQWLAEGPSEQQVRAACRATVLAVESLHSLGIIHGALHGRNIIVCRDGSVRLTHVSPLLYDDPENDRQALARILRRALPAGDEDDVDSMPLGEMARWVSVRDPAQAHRPADDDPHHEERRLRRGAIIGAAIALLAGAAVSAGLWWNLRGR